MNNSNLKSHYLSYNELLNIITLDENEHILEQVIAERIGKI